MNVKHCESCVCVLRLGLENSLRAEREQRQSLQKSLQREQDNSVELRTQLQQLQGLHEVSARAQMRRGNVCLTLLLSSHL